MTTQPLCPFCGSTFTIDDRAEKVVEVFPSYIVRRRPFPTRRTTVVAAFCNGCENVVELDTRF